MSEIILSEKPFTSIQGEGKTLGKFSFFIRFFGCNFRCSFCDSKFSYNGNNKTYRTTIKGIKELWEYSNRSLYNVPYTSRANNIVITGGEPLLFQSQIIELINTFLEKDEQISFEIETNGSLEMSKEFLFTLAKITNKTERILINISPKLHSEVKQYHKMVYDNINSLNLLGIPYVLKFVYENDEKSILSFINEMLTKKINFNNKNIYIMPECINREEHIKNTQRVLDFCLLHQFNFSPRLHILLWDNKKGV